MHRPYTRAEYLELVGRIRDAIPQASLSTDIIVGFPGESDEQYQRSLDLVSELRPDKVHCAAYSPRPGTIAGRTMRDVIPWEEQVRRRERLEQLQEGILRDINSALLGKKVEILVESRYKGKWQGRTRSDKLVFFQSNGDHLGQLVNLNITQAGPWSLQGALASGRTQLTP
jgi:tRNA-2-methylthio-N6-dimethylallyladenosine synthase